MSETIEQTCREAGLRVRDVQLRDGLLMLTPEDLDELPDPARLRELSERLVSEDVRWVTLVVEGAGE